jgi:heat shock protein HslJ
MLPGNDCMQEKTRMRRIAPIALTLLAGPAFAQDAPDGFVARGNEPGWTVEIADATLALTRMGEKGVASYPLPEPQTTTTGRRYAVADGPAVTITDAVCRDDATGMPFPAQVSVELDGAVLTGCGGDPLSLLTGAEWKVTKAGAAAVPEGVEATIAFAPDGGVSGSSGCNRFSGTATLTGEGLGFGPMAGTRMACDAPASTVEAAFLDAMGRIDRFDIADDGSLRLIAGDTALIEAGR